MATGIQSVALLPSPLIIFLPHPFVPLQSRSLSTLQRCPTVCTPTTDPFFHNHLIITYPAVLFNFSVIPYYLLSSYLLSSPLFSNQFLSSPFLCLSFLSRDQVGLCNTFLSVGWVISSFVQFFLFFFWEREIASSETPPPSLRQGEQIVPPDSNVTLEEVLLAVGEQVEHDNLSFASPMNKAVVVFLKDKANKFQLIDSSMFIKDTVVQVSPLSVPLHPDRHVRQMSH